MGLVVMYQYTATDPPQDVVPHALILLACYSGEAKGITYTLASWIWTKPDIIWNCARKQLPAAAAAAEEAAAAAAEEAAAAAAAEAEVAAAAAAVAMLVREGRNRRERERGVSRP
jgi:hypothetical protein